MQTLGLSESSLRTEGRIKSLFWPSITTATDVDYLGTQGYWLCTAMAFLSLFAWAANGRPYLALVVALFIYLAGVGVRERNVYAAFVVFGVFVLDLLVSP